MSVKPPNQEEDIRRMIEEVDPNGESGSKCEAAEYTTYAVLKEVGMVNIRFELTQLPVLGPHDIQVRVLFGGVNFADVYKCDGRFLEYTPLPLTLGNECSGKVELVGDYVTDFSAGDYVVCCSTTGGLFGTSVIVQSQICHKIRRDQLVTAVQIPVAYSTAYLALFKLGNLQPDKSVFFSSIGGSVGLAVADLVRGVKGAKVYGTCSDAKFDKLSQLSEKLKITKLFRYENWEKELTKVEPKGVDIFVDVLGGGEIKRAMKHVKPLGTAVALGSAAIVGKPTEFEDVWMADGETVSTFDILWGSFCLGGLHLGRIFDEYPTLYGEIMTEMLQKLDSKQINPKYHAIFPFFKIVSALSMLLNRKNIGKVLLQFDGMKQK